MGKGKNPLLLSLVFACLCISNVSLATTNCVQKFVFFALTRGYPTLSSHEESKTLTFWITEDIGGECMASQLIQIFISKEKVSSSYTSLMGYEEWDWLKEGTKHLQREAPKELVEKEGVWNCSTASFQVKAPMSDSAMLNSFREAAREGYERRWIQDHGLSGISMPIFEGINRELIYRHEAGLYIDYQISKAYYFPYSKYLLIFTHQPHLASGLDTMHGFLIFKIKK